MSNHAQNQQNHSEDQEKNHSRDQENLSRYIENYSQQVGPFSLLEFTPADYEAAHTLLSLRRGGSNRTAGETSQIWDIRVTNQKHPPASSTGNAGASRRRIQGTGNNPSTDPSPHDPFFELVERLRDIHLTHVNPPVVQPESEPDTFATPTPLPQIAYYHTVEVPGEVGLFVDMWDARGYSSSMIGEMLRRNNVIVPNEYIYRRTGMAGVQWESHVRSTAGREDPALSWTPAERDAYIRRYAARWGHGEEDPTWEDLVRSWIEGSQYWVPED